ncbi:MAG: hypothetical protein PHT33_14545 [bacterium]|nr:hypothetical protein [bacterium]
MAEKKIVLSEDKRLIATQEKNVKDEYRFSLFEFKGYKLAEIRVYTDSDTYQGPTRSGLTVRVDALDAFIANLEKLRAAAKEEGTEQSPLLQTNYKEELNHGKQRKIEYPHTDRL